MLQHTGSVYLDTPARTSRRPPERAVNATRVMLAGLCAAIGLFGLTAATIIVGVRALVLEADPVLDAFEATLDDPLARAELEQEVATAIESGFVGIELTEIAEVYGLDVPAEAERVSSSVLDDPGFRAALNDVITDVHSRVVIEPAAGDIDLAPISDAVLAVIERVAPDLAAIIPAGSTLWTLDAGSIPDLTGPARILNRSLSAALIAIIGMPLAAALHPRRHRVAAWLGRWALTAALVGALAAVGLPYLGGRITGWSTVEVAIRASSLRLLAPAGIAGVLGMGLASLAAVAASRERRKVVEEGAAAALGVNEPELWQQSAQPAGDLPRRDLIDAGHPLTNV